MAGGSINGVGGRVVELFVLRIDPWQKFKEFGRSLGGKLSMIDTFRTKLGRCCIGGKICISVCFRVFCSTEKATISYHLYQSRRGCSVALCWTLCASTTPRGPSVYQTNPVMRSIVIIFFCTYILQPPTEVWSTQPKLCVLEKKVSLVR